MTIKKVYWHVFIILVFCTSRRGALQKHHPCCKCGDHQISVEFFFNCLPYLSTVFVFIFKLIQRILSESDWKGFDRPAPCAGCAPPSPISSWDRLQQACDPERVYVGLENWWNGKDEKLSIHLLNLLNPFSGFKGCWRLLLGEGRLHPGQFLNQIAPLPNQGTVQLFLWRC